ncbi:MAG: S24 family peptidase [Vicinamibacterales bacterium]
MAAGSPLTIDDHEHARSPAFSATFLKRWRQPICVRVGPREESMLPVIAPGDVVLLERAGENRPPDPAGIYAVRVDDGSTLKRVQLLEQGERAWLALLSENPDKRKYGARLVPVDEGDRWQDHLIGRVVWHGQYV